MFFPLFSFHNPPEPSQDALSATTMGRGMRRSLYITLSAKYVKYVTLAYHSVKALSV